MRDGAHAVSRAVRGLHDRFDTRIRASESVTYRDAWRYSSVHGLMLASFAVTYFVIGSPIWSTFLAFVVPTMAAFTLGFAVRRGTARGRVLSLGIGIVGGGVPLAIPGVRDSLLAIGPSGLLLVWLLVVVGLLGYAFPDYGTVGG